MALKPPPRPVQTVTAIPLSSNVNRSSNNNNPPAANRVSRLDIKYKRIETQVGLFIVWVEQTFTFIYLR